jgi:hypothetical protein
MRVTAIICCTIIFSFHAVFAQEEYPKTQISNSELEVDIYLPDAEKGYYRGTRFEWSGLVNEVRYKGHKFFGDWKPMLKHDPSNHDDVSGIASEFGMGMFGVAGPWGYDDAKPGDSFLKIGIGLLKKATEEAYSPFTRYEIEKAFDWEISQGTDWIQFDQTIEPFQDWAYHYTKRIELMSGSPDMLVKHTIKNTGSKELSTTQYCHNFVKIDKEPVDENYEVRFLFPLEANREFGGYASVNQNRINIEKELGMKALFSEIGGFRDLVKHNSFFVEHKKNKASIFMNSTVPPLIYNFYAAKYVVCPEPFVDIQLKPGESLEWTNQYTFKAEHELEKSEMEWPLEMVVEGGLSTPKMPLKDFLAQIYFKTEAKFMIDEGIEAFVKADVTGNPTIQEVLNDAFKDKDLAFKKLYNGVIRIYRIEL